MTENSKYLEENKDKILVCEDVSRYFGALKALNHITFSVPTNSIFAIIGPNGAGKTTLFNVITGIYPQTSGTALFEGKSILGLPAHKVTELGMVRTYQIIQLFDKMTVLENASIGFYCRSKADVIDAILDLPRARKERMETMEKSMELLKWLDLAKYADYLAGNLPLGIRKRLQVARALATGPKLLLLDEPMGGMNISEKKAMGDLILQLKDNGLTILLVEHDMGVVMDLSDRIFVLNYGEELAIGTPDEIKHNPLVIEAYLGKGYLREFVEN
jgi:branched-chain amino acid transport system ATP-binding protein